MGLFNFIKNVTTATVKTALTPLAVVKDVVDGDIELSTTTNNLSDAIEDLENSVEEDD